MTRLQTYRAFLAAMSPSSSPKDALERGFYVEPPGGGIWSALTAKLELEPASTHLVLGGIGSGKTSELLRAREKLGKVFEETGDLAWYCDISQHHDLAAPSQAGVLFALTGLLTIDAAKHSDAGIPKTGEVAAAVQSIGRFAHGYVDWEDPHEYYQDEDEDEPPHDDGLRPVVHSGVLSKPKHKSTALDWRISPLIGHLRLLLDQHPGKGRTAIVLFDSLDRLPQPADFKSLIEDDIQASKAAGVGIVVVGPVRFIVGPDRALTDMFDHLHFQQATDPDTEQGVAFLCEVLRRRSAQSDLLPEACLPALARASGGILRDLIALANRSAEQAYATGHARITAQDVAHASEAFGRSLALGLDDDQTKILKALAKDGSFVVRGDRELSLLETRRVLLYPNNRWAVHPTLERLLETIPETSG